MQNRLLVIGLLLLLSTTCLLSQERITSIESDIDAQRILLHTYEEFNYMIRIDRLDNITVFVEEEGVASEVHSWTFSGISEANGFQFSGSRMLINNNDEYGSFDLVTGELQMHPVRENERFFRWYLNPETDSEAIATTIDNSSSLWLYTLVDFIENEIEDITDISILTNYSNQFFLHKVRGQYTEQWYKINRITDEVDLVYDGSILSGRSSLVCDQNFLYKTEDDLAIISVDLESLVKDTFMVLPPDITTCNLIKMDSLTLVSIKIDNNRSEISLYDHELNYVKTLKVEEFLRNAIPQVVEGKIVGENNRLMNIDTSTSAQHLFNYSYSQYVITTDNKMAIAYDDRILLADHHNNTLAQITNLSLNGPARDIQKIRSNTGKDIISIDNGINGSFSLFDLDGNAFRKSEILPMLSAGVRPFAKISKHGSSLVLNDDELYRIQENIVTPVTPRAIQSLRNDVSSIQYYNDKIWWSERQSGPNVRLRSFDGQVIKNYEDLEDVEFLNSQSSIIDFFASEDFLYYTNYESFARRVLYQYNIANEETTSKVELTTDESRSVRLVDDHLYFCMNDQLHEINGSQTFVYQDIDFVFDSNVFSINGAHYAKHADGLSLIQEGTSEYLLSNDYQIRQHKEILIASKESEELLIFDGTTQPIQVQPATAYDLTQPFGQRQILFYIQPGQSTGSITSYNIQTNEFTEVDEDLRTQRLIGTTTINDKTYIVARNYDNGVTSEVNIYSYTTGIHDVTQEASFVSRGSNIFMDVEKLGDGALVYIGSQLLSIDEEGNVEVLSDIIGDHQSSDLKSLENYVYFIAIDELLGRQLYRLPAESIVSSVNTIAQSLELVLYPNPTSGKVDFDLEDGIANVDILDHTGKILKSIKSTNSVDLCGFPAAVYYLSITSKNKNVTKKVVKY